MARLKFVPFIKTVNTLYLKLKEMKMLNSKLSTPDLSKPLLMRSTTTGHIYLVAMVHEGQKVGLGVTVHVNPSRADETVFVGQFRPELDLSSLEQYFGPITLQG